MTHEQKYNELYEVAFSMRNYQMLWDKFHVKSDGQKAIYYRNKLDLILNKETRERKIKENTNPQ